jgi:hypothetical protein
MKVKNIFLNISFFSKNTCINFIGCYYLIFELVSKIGIEFFHFLF